MVVADIFFWPWNRMDGKIIPTKPCTLRNIVGSTSCQIWQNQVAFATKVGPISVLDEASWYLAMGLIRCCGWSPVRGNQIHFILLPI